MLFTNNATTSIAPHPSAMGANTNQPRADMLGSTTTISAVAPAGGWTVPVRAMRAVAQAQESAPPSQRRPSRLDERAKSLEMATPMAAETNWPRMALRGCARGDSMA